ncbi:MAG TPA: lysoplasmalogenase [Chloroflexi bacterium]|nr:lysoplasmalogenase [Chloroflexota bacterium]
MLKSLVLVLAMVFILWDWYETRRMSVKIRYLTKPMATALIWLGLVLHLPTMSWPVWLFVVGLALGLAGDIFLMFWGESFFKAGLASFFLGHIAYIIGFLASGSVNSPGWALLMAVIPIVIVAFFFRIIIGKVEGSLKLPVIAYSLVINLMLYMALLNIFRLAWGTTATILSIAGSALFVLSDSLLAYDRFARLPGPPRNELWVMITYHLAQISIAAAVILRFAG